jgi:hypothetical protein
MQGEVKLTVIATGFGIKPRSSEAEPAATSEFSRLSEQRPEFGADEVDDLNIPAFLRHRV